MLSPSKAATRCSCETGVTRLGGREPCDACPLATLERIEQSPRIGVECHGLQPRRRGGRGRLSLTSIGAGHLAFKPNRTCAHEAHAGILRSVPVSVPKPGPTTITRQPTPTKRPIKNGPETVDFSPSIEHVFARHTLAFGNVARREALNESRDFTLGFGADSTHPRFRSPRRCCDAAPAKLRTN
jgi:hypothetical protein